MKPQTPTKKATPALFGAADKCGETHTIVTAAKAAVRRIYARVMQRKLIAAYGPGTPSSKLAWVPVVRDAKAGFRRTAIHLHVTSSISTRRKISLHQWLR